MYLLIYSKNHKKCSPSPWHYSWCLLHTGLATECVCRYISKTMGTVPLHHDTIHVFITYGYIDGMCSMVYSRDHGNCSPSP